jgi:quinol monooxygenase YgiN
MSKIQATVRFKIDAGKLHEFQNLVNQCLQIVRQKDKETLQYDIFYDEMASECVIREMYEHSKAFMDHLSNVDEYFSKMIGISTFSAEVYGFQSSALANALSNFKTKSYRFSAGI